MRKIKVFYGWYIAAAGVLISAIAGGAMFYGFTAFVNPIANTLAFSYAQISLAMTLRGVEGGVLSPFMGRVVDRWPAKWLILIGIIVSGLGYLCLSQTTNLAMLYVSFTIMALGGSLGIGMAPTATVARWFRKNIGKASGVLAFGIGLGGLFTPIIVKLVDTYGWRTSVVT